MKNYDKALIKKLTEVAEEYSNKYISPDTTTEEEALGLALSHHFHWDISAICRCFGEALEDANAHKEAAIAREWADSEYRLAALILTRIEHERI